MLPYFHSLSSSLLCMTQDDSSLSSRSTSSFLSELRTALQAFDLASARVNTVSAALSHRHLRPLSQSPSHVSLVPPPPPVIAIAFPAPALPPFPARTPLLRGGYICSGDLVQITNPRAHQPHQGFARYARGRFIYIEGSNGQYIQGYESNLNLISPYDEL